MVILSEIIDGKEYPVLINPETVQLLMSGVGGPKTKLPPGTCWVKLLPMGADKAIDLYPIKGTPLDVWTQFYGPLDTDEDSGESEEDDISEGGEDGD